MILQGARPLGVEGMERLVADLKAAILSALAGGSPGAWPDACPRCGCARVVRRGRGGDGVSAQADELYLNESFSGRRSGMPREPHANGHGVRSRGISSLKVAVVTVVNDLGDCTAVLAARGRPGAEQIRAGLAPACVAGSEVSTDMRSSYAAPLSEAGAASHNRYGAADAGEDELGMVNALHERLRGFLWRFRGVSTRRLQRYLWWFCWEERVRRSDASREAVLRSHVANGSYESTRRDLEEEPQPFWDFWESRDESDVSNLV